MKRLGTILTAGALVLAAAQMPAGAEPSKACDFGEVPSNTGVTQAPAGRVEPGFGADRAGSPQSVTRVTACYIGSQPILPVYVPRGLVSVTLSATAVVAAVTYDGDSGNDAFHQCADGYYSARVDPSGASLYAGDEGDWTTSTKTNSPQEIVALAQKCATAPPPNPTPSS